MIGAPAHRLVTERVQAKILDFGLAKPTSMEATQAAGASEVATPDVIEEHLLDVDGAVEGSVMRTREPTA